MTDEKQNTPSVPELTPAPASPAPFDAFKAMRQEMDQVVNRFGGSLFGRIPTFGAFFGEDHGESLTQSLTPTVDVHETADKIEIDVELPGMTEKDVEVTVRDGVLRIKGERRYDSKNGDGEDKKAHIVEGRYGMFERSFGLPQSVDPHQVSADVKKGVV